MVRAGPGRRTHTSNRDLCGTVVVYCKQSCVHEGWGTGEGNAGDKRKDRACVQGRVGGFEFYTRVTLSYPCPCPFCLFFLGPARSTRSPTAQRPAWPGSQPAHATTPPVC